jgi:hypothetical protein
MAIGGGGLITVTAWAALWPCASPVALASQLRVIWI